jgi:hypothetical protein
VAKKKRARELPADAAAVLRLADAYRGSGKLLEGEIAKITGASTGFFANDGALVPVVIVQYAFALELYLKALYVANYNDWWPDDVHFYEQLFDSIPQAQQDKIAKGWAHDVNVDNQQDRTRLVVEKKATIDEAVEARPTVQPSDLRGVLFAARDTFVAWRYYFERKDLPGGTQVQAIPWIRREINHLLKRDDPETQKLDTWVERSYFAWSRNPAALGRAIVESEYKIGCERCFQIDWNPYPAILAVPCAEHNPDCPRRAVR